MRLGPCSPEGYYFESHQLDLIRDGLLDPFAMGADSVLTAAFDEPSDQPFVEMSKVEDRAILVFDGLFLQRPELRSLWSMVVYLEADRRLDERWLSYLTADLPGDPGARAKTLDDRLLAARWPRYRAGWSIYVDAEHPADGASIVIDNNDFGDPFIISEP